jgi:hypothetical protein
MEPVVLSADFYERFSRWLGQCLFFYGSLFATFFSSLQSRPLGSVRPLQALEYTWDTLRR